MLLQNKLRAIGSEKFVYFIRRRPNPGSIIQVLQLFFKLDYSTIFSGNGVDGKQSWRPIVTSSAVYSSLFLNDPFPLVFERRSDAEAWLKILRKNENLFQAKFSLSPELLHKIELYVTEADKPFT